MATGIPNITKSPDYNNTLKYIPVELKYYGKEKEDDILKSSFQRHDNIVYVNSERFSDNTLYWGDNFDVLLQLLHDGKYKNKIKLIYIDPPFSTKGVFNGKDQEHAYSDILSGAQFVEFLRKRLILLCELLSDDGSIYVHLDNNMIFDIKIIMDEIFGIKNFRAFITRQKCSNKNYTKNTYGNISDYILFYSKTNKFIWNRPMEKWDKKKIEKEYPYIDEKTKKRYKKVPIHAPGIRNGETGKPWRGMLPPIGKHWQYTPEKLEEFDRNGEIYWSSNGNPRRKVFFDDNKGIPIQDIWLNYRDSINQNIKTTGYPTEKNIAMLKQIVTASSNEGDYILDCFCGSGTTMEAAYSLKRKWIGIDNSEKAIKAVLKRFVSGMEIYGDYVNIKKSLKEQNLFENLYENKCAFNIITNQNNLEALRNYVCECMND